MKIAIVSLMALTAAGLAFPVLTQEASEGHGPERPGARSDADRLYYEVKAARAEVRKMRELAGLHAHPAGPHIDPAGHHEGESAADQKRERSEREGHEDGRRVEGGERGHGEGGEGGERGHGEGGERGERGHGEGGERGRREEGNNRIPKLVKHDETYRNGARLILQYNPATQAFVGSVQNTTRETLSEVRVEIHLSNGLELGPTKRVDLKAGATTPVELSALDQEFAHWVTHPEAGVEEAHGSDQEETEGHAGREARGEHGGEGGEGGRGEGGGDRPGAGSLRPVHNQILLLRGEMRAFAADLAASQKQ
jgi:hypothetical protein